MYIKKTAFTLVELLVVITVLSILATISYIYFDGNLGEARDAKRKTDLGEIVRVLELYQTENGNFPEPSDAVNITYSGSAIAWTQGDFGESVGQEIKVFGNDYPRDPLYGNNYTYSTTNSGREFQIAAIYETYEQEDGLGDLAVGNILDQSYAGSVQIAYVQGDYNGIMLKARTGAIDTYIASPSIIANDISNPDVISIITGRKLVYNEFFNLPASYSGFLDLEGGFNFNVTDPVVFSGESNALKDEAELLEFNSNLKYIYATTPTESFDTYLSILEKDGLTTLKGFMERKFKIQFRSYFNCKDILDAGLSEGDRMYVIDPDGDDGNPAYEVYCDMTTDGGGWTRVGDNQLVNGNFSGGVGVPGAYEYFDEVNQIVALTTPVDGNNYALHQTGNYSSYYKVGFPDPDILKPGYEVRMTLWRSDYGSGVVDTGVNNVVLMGGKNTPWTLGTCTSGTYCYFRNFNSKLANTSNFGAGGALTDINVSVKNPVSTVTTSYLDGGVLFDGYIPTTGYTSAYGGIYSYTNGEILAIDEWVQAGGFLISTNNEDTWDPIGEFYNMPTKEYNDGKGVLWEVQNIDHPLVNGSIGLGVDLRGKTLVGQYAHASLNGIILPDDVILAKDKYAPYSPTVLLRKHGKGYILFVSDDGMFVQMSSGNTFDINDYETVFAAAIMAFGIESAAGINPHEGYVFHNKVHYNDGTFSTNGEDAILESIVINDGGIDRTWTKEQTRHKIYKVPESFDWYIGLDANNNKDLYFTGLRLELFYR